MVCMKIAIALSLLVVLNVATLANGQSDVVTGVYPACLTSPYTFTGLAKGTWATYRCLGVVPSSFAMTVNSANSDYLDVVLMDEVTYSNFVFSGIPYTCMCSSICFKQGSQSSGAPNPKTGTCTIRNTTATYAVIFNQNYFATAGSIVVSGSFSPIQASSSTGGSGSSGSIGSTGSSTGSSGLVSSTGSASTDYASQWAGSYTMDSSCSQTQCCCLTGTITITKISTTSVQLNGALAGSGCGQQSTLSGVFSGLTASLTWSGTVLGNSYTFTRLSTGISATNNAAAQCSGGAIETANAAIHAYGGAGLAFSVVMASITMAATTFFQLA